MRPLVHELMLKAQEHQAQILLVGDPKQLSAVEAGNPYKSLIETGMQQARLKDFRRQLNPTLNRAVQMLYHRMGPEAFKLIEQEGWVQEVTSLEQRAQVIAGEYLALSLEQRGKTLVLAGTHQEREAITTHIRKGLQAEGVLGADFGKIAALKSKGLTVEQRQHGRSYRVGDVVVPTRNNNALRGSRHYRVESVQGGPAGAFEQKVTVSSESLT